METQRECLEGGGGGTHFFPDGGPPLDESLKVTLAKNLEILAVGLDARGGEGRLAPAKTKRI